MSPIVSYSVTARMTASVSDVPGDVYDLFHSGTCCTQGSHSCITIQAGKRGFGAGSTNPIPV